jgi:hypothetical protein
MICINDKTCSWYGAFKGEQSDLNVLVLKNSLAALTGLCNSGRRWTACHSLLLHQQLNEFKCLLFSDWYLYLSGGKGSLKIIVASFIEPMLAYFLTVIERLERGDSKKLEAS